MASTMVFAQSVCVNMLGDTITNLSEIYPNQHKMIVSISNKSCTGCKDNLNKTLTAIDTAICPIILVKELHHNLALLRREAKAEMNNYFVNYNLLIFKITSQQEITPQITLMDKNNNQQDLSYQFIFNGIQVSEYAKNKLFNFVNSIELGNPMNE